MRRILFWAGCCLLASCGGQARREAPPPAPGALFRDAAAETGLQFHHFNGATGGMYMPEIVGSGAALFDYDNDGDLDVYLVQGGSVDPAKTPGDAKPPLPKGWRPGNRLFENRLIPEGKLHFVDVTERAGVGYAGAGMGVAAGDPAGCLTTKAAGASVTFPIRPASVRLRARDWA